jgi:hypothetical protein
VLAGLPPLRPKFLGPTASVTYPPSVRRSAYRDTTLWSMTAAGPGGLNTTAGPGSRLPAGTRRSASRVVPSGCGARPRQVHS